jgi:hypothetical protein
MPKPSSPRRSPEQWRKVIDDFLASGLSAPAFAKQVGVYPQRLSYWKCRFEREKRSYPAPIPTFLPVAVQTKGSEVVASPKNVAFGQFELSIREHYTLTIPSNFEQASFTRLLLALREALC